MKIYIKKVLTNDTKYAIIKTTNKKGNDKNGIKRIEWTGNSERP